MQNTLPIESILEPLATALTQQAVVLQAPPGAGKSTRLPLYLLQSLPQHRWLLVQPRRLAALSIASYLAAELEQPVGQSVGYQIRQQRRYSDATKLLIVTEGVLTRMLQDDPELSDFDGVIFDEFHERNLHSDLGLALVLESRQLRPELKLLVMSATLPADALADWLQRHDTEAQVLASNGRQFPVSIEYAPPKEPQRYLQHTADVVCRQLREGAQGVLVFLPGQGEIRQLQQLLSDRMPADLTQVSVLALHGGLDVRQQREVVSARSGRKVIVTTNIAETSLTIDGIDLVIDSGRERQAQFRPRYGTTELITRRISRAAADQRAGRAGRLGPGRCIRLYPASDYQAMADYRPADIEQQDLRDLLLQVASWGSEVERLAWFTAPNAGHLASAKQHLQQQGLLQGSAITALGQSVSEYATDVANARLLQLVAAESEPVRALAALVVANAEEREATNIRLDDALQAILQAPQRHSRTQRSYRHWRNKLEIDKAFQLLPEQLETSEIARQLMAMNPLSVARRRDADGKYQMASGAGVEWPKQGVHAVGDTPPWIVVTDLSFHESHSNGFIRQYLPLTEGAVAAAVTPLAKIERHASWRSDRGGLGLFKVARLGVLELERQALAESPTAADRQEAFIELVRQHGLGWLNWSDKTEQLRRRIQLYFSLQCTRNLQNNSLHPAESLSDQALLESLPQWAAPFWAGLQTQQQLQAWDPAPALLQLLDYEQQRELAALLPERWQAPSGRSHAIDYQPDGTATVRLKLQETFGAPQTPKIANGRCALVLELLSPAGRLLARTNDLAGFWQGAYHEVRKEMRGRYPKHPWPENPASAQPTHLTKKALHGK